MTWKVEWHGPIAAEALAIMSHGPDVFLCGGAHCTWTVDDHSVTERDSGGNVIRVAAILLPVDGHSIDPRRGLTELPRPTGAVPVTIRRRFAAATPSELD